MPKRLGKYDIGRTLGEGSFGKVKYAVNLETNEAVAIKVSEIRKCWRGKKEGREPYGNGSPLQVREMESKGFSYLKTRFGVLITRRHDASYSVSPEYQHTPLPPSLPFRQVLDKAKIVQLNMGRQVKKEISIMKLIRHSSVVSLVEVLVSKTKIFIVLELVTGGELFEAIAR